MNFNEFCENGKKIKLTDEKKREIISICKENESNIQKSILILPTFKRISVVLCALIVVITIGLMYKKYINLNDIFIHSGVGQSAVDCSENSSVSIESTTDKTDSLQLSTLKDIGGGDLGLLKYRMNYYNVPAPFANIVEAGVYNPWYDEIALENPNETNVMVMKKFIQYFDISREDFDKANLEWAKIIIEGFDGIPMVNPQDFANQETDEVYNADILYTFDDEIINNYYLSHDYPFVYADEYEAAVENGTYQTKTVDWIDIEQMEAEIIAKYGEAEIVTETTTVISEDIATTDSLQIETTE